MVVSSWRKDAKLRILRVYFPFWCFTCINTCSHVLVCFFVVVVVISFSTERKLCEQTGPSKMGLSWAKLMSIRYSIHLLDIETANTSLLNDQPFPIFCYSTDQRSHASNFSGYRFTKLMVFFCCCVLSFFTSNISP